MVRDITTIGGEAQLPFGGSKATGVGEREMAEEGLNFFTELKTVFINFSGKAERLLIRLARFKVPGSTSKIQDRHVALLINEH